MKIPIIKNWHTPVSDLPDQSIGNVRLETVVYDGTYASYGLRGYDFYQAQEINIKQLVIDGEVWMVDDPPHQWAMEQHAQYFSGTVLCAGLGLGLIAHTLSENPRVDSVVLVEREQDVVSLIEPTLSEKCCVLHGDFYDFIEEYSENSTILGDYYNINGVFYDLFVGDGETLVLEAIMTYKNLCRWFPNIPIRIHGFNNQGLEKLVRSM